MVYMPETITDLLRDPQPPQWKSHLRGGVDRKGKRHGKWAGPDGASGVPDRLMGVRIGKVSPIFEDYKYPANRHDWRYRLGREFALPKAWRQRVDAQFKYDLRKELALHMGGTMYAIGWVRSAFMYWAVRMFGGRAWRQT
jgi:hypothetical protein